MLFRFGKIRQKEETTGFRETVYSLIPSGNSHTYSPPQPCALSNYREMHQSSRGDVEVWLLWSTREPLRKKIYEK